ncbi:MAG: type 4b pilus protein PilO2 [bacterium]
MKIIEIAGKTYYTGFSWQTLSADDNVKERLKEFKDGFYCVRNLSGMINLGYSQETELKYKKLPSLAANVANAKKEPWIGVFHISDNLYWLIAVRDNQAILPDGDIIGTKEEIDKIFHETLPIGEWDSVIESGNIKDIESILTGKNAYVLPIKKTPTGIIIIAGIIISVFILYIYYRHTVNQIKPKIFVPKMFIQKKPVKIPGPEPQLVLSACKKELLTIPQSYYGWEPTNLNCSDNNILVTYKKQAFGTTFVTPQGNILQNGAEVSQNISLDLARPVKFRKILSSQNALKILYGYMQEFNIRGNVSVNANKFIIDLNMNNLNILPIFFNIPTFRIENIKITGLPENEHINITAEVWHD